MLIKLSSGLPLDQPQIGCIHGGLNQQSRIYARPGALGAIGVADPGRVHVNSQLARRWPVASLPVYRIAT
ncbi:hypothetical protein [Micromonospora echinospora]|uniref:hypothetical protein n=1 Tax=Micromonospora echinospora TaxID=1877 RepID=UPI00117DDEEF|nr:hypothetical protein [Micromonospora echinospora]